MNLSARERQTYLRRLAICLERLASRLVTLGSVYGELEEAIALAHQQGSKQVRHEYRDNVVKFWNLTDRVLSMGIKRAGRLALVLGEGNPHREMRQADLAHYLESIRSDLIGCNLNPVANRGSLPVVQEKRQRIAGILSGGAAFKLLTSDARWMRHASDAVDGGTTASAPSPDPETGGGSLDDAPNVIRREGNIWRVSYQGESTSFAHTKGIGYIHRLIESSPAQVSAVQLHFGIRAESIPRRSPQEIMTNENLSVLRRLIADTQDNLVAATAAEEIEEKNRLTDKLGELKAALAQGEALGGRPRVFPDDERERARKAVGRSIRYAREMIGQKIPALDSHLGEAIKNSYGHEPAYVPDHPVRWLTQPVP